MSNSASADAKAGSGSPDVFQVLPPAIIARDIAVHIEGWLNSKVWERRRKEITVARKLL